MLATALHLARRMPNSIGELRGVHANEAGVASGLINTSQNTLERKGPRRQVDGHRGSTRLAVHAPLAAG